MCTLPMKLNYTDQFSNKNATTGSLKLIAINLWWTLVRCATRKSNPSRFTYTLPYDLDRVFLLSPSVLSSLDYRKSSPAKWNNREMNSWTFDQTHVETDTVCQVRYHMSGITCQSEYRKPGADSRKTHKTAYKPSDHSLNAVIIIYVPFSRVAVQVCLCHV